MQGPIRRRLAHVGGATAALAIITAMVAQTSSAVFVDVAENTGNSFAAATMTLTPDHGATAMFAVTGAIPGDSFTRCITITYAGTAAASDLDPVKLYANANYNDTSTGSGAFSSVLKLTVKRDDSFVGAASSPSDCTGFSSDATLYDGSLAGYTIERFTDTDGHVDYATGLAAGWTPSANGQTRGYQVTVTFDSSAGSDFQNAVLGTTTPLTLTWELRTGAGAAQ